MKHVFKLIPVVALLAGLFALLPETPSLGTTTSVDCSSVDLVGAIVNHASGDTLSLAAGCAYTLSTAYVAEGPLDLGPDGLPSISDTLTIDGNGASIVRSSANGTGGFRVFEIEPGGLLVLDSLTVSNGSVPADDGGAVLNEGTVETNDVTFSDNAATDGGAIQNGFGSASGSLTATSSTFSANSASSVGGAIDNIGTLDATDTSFTSNSGSEGGAVANSGTSTIDQSTLATNTASTDGGAISNAVDGSTATLTVDQSTFDTNTSDKGGAIANAVGADDGTGSATVTRSTFYNNAGYFSPAGVVYADSQGTNSVAIVSSTFYSSYGSNGGSDPFIGAENVASGSVALAGDLLDSGQTVDCTGTITDKGYNVASDTTCLTHGSTSTSFSTLADDFDAFGNYGGPTETIPQISSSPGVGVIPASTSVSIFSVSHQLCSITDERGWESAASSSCDVGAVQSAIAIADPAPQTVGVSMSDTPSIVGGVSPIVWSLGSGTLPSGVTIDATTGAISGAPSASGSFNFSLEATDANDATALFPLSLTVNAVPSITTTSLDTRTLGVAKTEYLSLSGGTSPFDWTLSSGSLPSGLQLGSASGAISGAASVSGTFPVTVEVTDARGATTSQSFSLVVNASPSISTASLAPFTVGTSSQDALAVSGGTSPFSWSITSGTLPPGLAISSSSGAISGSARAVGTGSITVQVADANGATASKVLSITSGSIPAFTSSASATATTGDAISVSITTSCYPTPVLSASGLPGGMTFTDNGDGTASLVGTPTSSGVSTFSITASNLVGSTAQSFTLSVTAPPTTTTSTTTTTTTSTTTTPFAYLPPAQTPGPPPRATVGTSNVVLKNGTSASIPVSCAAATCSGTVKLVEQTTTKVPYTKKVGKKIVTAYKTTVVTTVLGTASFSLKKGKSATETLVLDAMGKKVVGTATTKKTLHELLETTVRGGNATTKAVVVS